MNLAIVTAGFYDKDYDEKFMRLKWSADTFGIKLEVFGKGEFFSFFDSKINKLGVVVNNLKNKFTHVLYTDFADSFFLSGITEILLKYDFMKNPSLLVSGEKTIYPFPDFANLFPDDGGPYRFMNPGNFLGTIDAVLAALNACKPFYNIQNNDQAHWMLAYRQGTLPPIVVDTKARIFQTMADCKFEKEFKLGKNGLYNIKTDSYPCIVHFNGPKGPGTENDRLMNLVFNNLKKQYEVL